MVNDKDNIKTLKIESLGEPPNMKALCFTFNEQIEYGKCYFLFP